MARSRRGAAVGSKPESKSFFHRGDEARELADREAERAKQRSNNRGKQNPFRFFVPVGETKEFIILDESPDFYLYEHTIPDPVTGKWNNHIVCPRENEPCAACDEYGISSLVLFLSVIDLTPYTDSKGNTHEWSRKLMAVKPSQEKKFKRKWIKDGTLRGAVYETTRDGPKDAAIGSDIEFIEWAPEDELENDYIRQWTDREGTEHEENMGEPFVYEEIFEAPDAAKIRALLGVEPPLGSSEQQTRDLESDDDWEDKDDDDEPWDAKDDSDATEDVEDTPRESGKRASRSSRRSSRADSSSSSERPRRARKSKDTSEKSGRGGRRSRRTR